MSDTDQELSEWCTKSIQFIEKLNLTMTPKNANIKKNVIEMLSKYTVNHRAKHADIIKKLSINGKCYDTLCGAMEKLEPTQSVICCCDYYFVYNNTDKDSDYIDTIKEYHRWTDNYILHQIVFTKSKQKMVFMCNSQDNTILRRLEEHVHKYFNTTTANTILSPISEGKTILVLTEVEGTYDQHKERIEKFMVNLISKDVPLVCTINPLEVRVDTESKAEYTKQEIPKCRLDETYKKVKIKNLQIIYGGNNTIINGVNKVAETETVDMSSSVTNWLDQDVDLSDTITKLKKNYEEFSKCTLSLRKFKDIMLGMGYKVKHTKRGTCLTK